MLTPRQQKFAVEYCKCLNASEAARRAGYSVNTCAEIGWENLRKPQIKAAIEARMKEMQLSADETQKLITDIAKSSLNDYFVVKKVERTPRITRTLGQLINELEAEICFEDEYADAAGLSDEELSSHVAMQKYRRKMILRYQMELKADPAATRIVNGPTELIDVAELDMVKLVADKEKGRIKSIAPGQFGMKVEMYSADAALTNLAKIHGLFEKDNEQQALKIIVKRK